MPLGFLGAMLAITVLMPACRGIPRRGEQG